MWPRRGPDALYSGSRRFAWCARALTGRSSGDGGRADRPGLEEGGRQGPRNHQRCGSTIGACLSGRHFKALEAMCRVPSCATYAARIRVARVRRSGRRPDWQESARFARRRDRAPVRSLSPGAIGADGGDARAREDRRAPREHDLEVRVGFRPGDRDEGARARLPRMDQPCGVITRKVPVSSIRRKAAGSRARGDPLAGWVGRSSPVEPVAPRGRERHRYGRGAR